MAELRIHLLPQAPWSKTELRKVWSHLPTSFLTRAPWKTSIALVNYNPTTPVKLAATRMQQEAERDSKRRRSWENDEGGVVWDSVAIAEAVGGEVIKEGASGSICTDTRSLLPNQWFLALVGTRFDGHEFLQAALARGCAGVVGLTVPQDWPRGFVQVKRDTVKALQDLGSSVRSRYQGTVVGITGSAGKTTARAMTALALQTQDGFQVHETKGNFNNHIGVPLTLLRMPCSSTACILELGMNHAGEISELAEIAKPNVRVILNIGPAHMENFPGGLMAVAAAKGELFATAQAGDVCVVNADDPLVMALPVPSGVRMVKFGTKEGCDVRLVATSITKGGCAVHVVLEHTHSQELGMLDNSSVISTVEFEISSPGRHLAMNACAAAAVATSLGVPLTSIGQSLSRYKPVGMRCRLEELGLQTFLINDCYNSNPVSAAAALQLLLSMHTLRRIAILGDMLELGAISIDAHKEILQLCCDLELDLVVVLGPCFSTAAESIAAAKILTYSNAEALADHIVGLITPGDTVLVKGSRGMQMEVIVNAIKAQASSWHS
ncbi:unnamed protein product [Sphagnum troendelagicum]|uniref:UDP-MurNAc-pentapeptide synthetase n=1 Tax=Sphagnum troendelagicum TaxID=128251 RepID=A0ABP0TMX7_9BRYO